MNQMQQQVADFVAQNRLETDVVHRLLDVMSEVGELSKEVLKASSYGSQPFVPGAAWKDELGDVIFSLICVANTTRVDVEEAVQGALQKYRGRISQKGNAGSEIK